VDLAARLRLCQCCRSITEKTGLTLGLVTRMAKNRLSEVWL
jgi:hypothetical protein